MNELVSNQLLIQALRRQTVARTPVWIMRQAGRYLPEYRQLRQQAGSFMQLCQTPELACAATLQPLARFKLDAAILFSDILTIPDAMGLGLSFVDGEGPRFAKPVQTARDIAALHIPDPETELGYVMDTIRLIKPALSQRVPLIGFAGSPWTLACYMIEAGPSQNFSKIKKLIYQQPQLAEQLLTTLSQSVTVYLQAQIAAGVDVVMLFDTWGGILTTRDYQQFSLRYLQQITHVIKTTSPTIPVIVFTKGGGQWLEMLAAIGCDAVGLDWTTDLKQARQRIGHQVALQGNLDPAILSASPDAIRQRTTELLQQFGAHPGHIFNLGHGITPDIDPEHVTVMIDTVREVSQRIHHDHVPCTI